AEEEKPQEKVEEKAEEVPEVKAEEKVEEVPEVKAEEKPQEPQEAPKETPQEPQETPEEKPAAKDAAATPTGIPGGFPNTPALAAEQDREASVSPLPAANGALNPIKLSPGEEVPKATTEDVNTNVKLDQESYEKSDALPAEDLKDKPVSVDPLPAAAGAVNPVKLEPGQEVPKATAEEVNKNVKLDKESYEKSDALPQSGMPPVSNNMIPESSLPVVGAAEAALISSAGPESSTAKLAGQVPKEPKAEKAVEEKPAAAVPEPVKESIVESGSAPEAAASDAKVEEKKKLEEEVRKSVPTVPAVATPKVAEPKEEEAPKVVEPKEEAPKVVEPKEEAPKAAETPAETKKEEAAKPAEGAATNGAKKEEAPPAKKKNRLSTMFAKLKNKFSE
ncbi:hypothetical protein IMZ48_16320, partial [Candidatus Bathyarchaeota archaeon]|nr:hypothetical protein [Candidatus Bathyarchaeota archaeon]